MAFNPDSDEALNKTLAVYGDNHTNDIFCSQIANAMLNLGVEETLSCMARFMCAVAYKQQSALEFDCDIGTVQIDPKEIPNVH